MFRSAIILREHTLFLAKVQFKTLSDLLLRLSLLTLALCSYSCCLVLLVGHYLYRCTVHFVVYISSKPTGVQIYSL